MHVNCVKNNKCSRKFSFHSYSFGYHMGKGVFDLNANQNSGNMGDLTKTFVSIKNGR